MKLRIISLAVNATLLCFVLLSFSSCSKSEQPAPPAKNNWVKVYNNIMLGDQENKAIGHFLKTRNGSVVAVENAQSEQAYLSMMYYTQYGGNYVVLTFPGNGRSASAYPDIDENRLFIQNPGGIDHWQQANLNTGEIHLASRDGVFMSNTEFDALAAAGSWAEFNTKFNDYNGGESDLFAGNYAVPGNGEVYLIQLNNFVRGILRVKSVVPKSANGGSVKFDLIIEGGDDYSVNTEANNVQPSKD